MRYLLTFLFFVLTLQSFSQEKKPKSLRKETNDTLNKAKINQYAIITLEQDTSYVDTSLSIKSDYKHNYLKKDMLECFMKQT